jgi:hypothetical protein
MNKYLNFFVAYENAGPHYENQLTRALLVVLRYSPMAHQVWMRLVASELNLEDLPIAHFRAQSRTVRQGNAPAQENDLIRGISVLVEPPTARAEMTVASVDRNQVLDGIIEYGEELVVVIENKIWPDMLTLQPSQINLNESHVQFDRVAKIVHWSQLLKSFADLVMRKLVTGSEALLLLDFLDLVQSHFSHLGPYSKLSHCANEAQLIQHRLDSLLTKLLESEIRMDPGYVTISGAGKIAMAQLKFSETTSTVELCCYPADTLSQARVFYGDPNSVRRVLALSASKWTVIPNYHWGHVSSGLAFMDSPCQVDLYCDYWIGQIAFTNQLSRPDWETAWSALQLNQIVSAADKQIFDDTFTNTARQTAQPRPGLKCEFSWLLREAIKYDDRGTFDEMVRFRLNEILTALGAPNI